ncbi:MAG: T9SS type A sorting domain-containing protein [Ignavibacteria bacterium]|nr:T9SS type A sorting domain-containing protein [Ignavibacteria bacterium]
MRNFTIITSLLLTAIILSFGFQGDKSDCLVVNNVVIQFEATNGNGNNLWLDNFSFGTRYTNDLTIASMNIRDKNYMMPGVTNMNITPVVTVLNSGRTAPSGATITLTDQSAYTSTKPISSVSAGGTIDVSFDALPFSINASKNLKAYINWSSDQNHMNDTLTQASVYLAGVQKKILFEAHTATTCGPCASQNPALDAFVQTHFDSIIAIKYHVWWPALGDPMYNANVPQARIRTQYNSVSAVPCLMVDGIIQQVSGYTTITNLQTPFDTRRAKASPIAISVTDTRLAGDTIKATISINVVSALPSNIDYRLRINAIERKITYSSPPGSNGETVFYDVFRRMYPSMDGIPINYSPGTYTVEYKYKRDAAWVDSMLYTAVFIQDEFNHEVINCEKARNYYADEKITVPSVVDNSVIPMTNNLSDSPLLQGNGVSMENMESPFPPPGWRVINADSNFTFWQYTYSAVNGPSMPGSRCLRINYYSYAENVGSKDYIRTKVFNNVNPGDTISFDWAYAQRPGYNDRLAVKISTDGGNTFPYTLFDRQGSVLGTAPSSSSGFVPTASQWGTFSISYANALGVNPSGAITPVKYSLSQNYPNPFNPFTRIKFEIPKNSFVTLRVFDILGRETAVILSENMKAGSYDVPFDASNLTSGVYFYKITAGDFSSIRKMLLIK